MVYSPNRKWCLAFVTLVCVASSAATDGGIGGDDGSDTAAGEEHEDAEPGGEEKPYNSTNHTRTDDAQPTVERYPVAMFDFHKVATPLIISIWVIFASLAKLGKLYIYISSCVNCLWGTGLKVHFYIFFSEL